MSRGQIREESYNLNRGEKFSKYNITFTRNSVFVPLKDIPIIPYAVDSNVMIAELLKDGNMDRQLDTVGILLNIGEERIFEKDDRSIYKKTLQIGDPVSMKSIEVVLWNKDLIIDPDWLGRTVQLKTFKLNSYRDTLSLNSLFKSEIKQVKNHRFASYEGKYQDQDFQNITDMNNGGTTATKTKEKSVKTIR